ncbi:MAG: permease, partial [Pseudomonadota bacterium]|nr:permease [Pseudomonadota bacterium]
MVLTILLTGLALLATAFAVVLGRAALKRGTGAPGPESLVLGAVANFFDTLGIGSFAPTTA